MNANQSTTESRETSGPPATTSRLVFPHGVANLTIRVDASMPERYRASFYGPKPNVSEANGAISIDYPRFNPLIWGRTSADVTISPATAWAIEVRGGVAHWDGDLRNVELEGIDVQGGMSQVSLQLPPARGSVRFHVSGGVSHLTVRRPADVPARLHIGGGASRVALDDQTFGAMGGPISLETGGYSTARDRYTVEVGGGASQITIGRE